MKRAVLLLMLPTLLSACADAYTMDDGEAGTKGASQHINSNGTTSRIIGLWKRMDPIYGIQYLTFTASNWSVKMDCKNSDGTVTPAKQTYTFPASISGDKVTLSGAHSFKTDGCSWHPSTLSFRFTFKGETQAELYTEDGSRIGLFQKQ